MSDTIKTIGVLTSGGDAPGMNAAIRAVVRKAIQNGVAVKGIKRGYQGLLAEEIIDMNKSSVSDTIQKGGTILGTARCSEFVTEEGQKMGAEICRKHGIDGIVAIGGDGTFRGATDLSVRGIPTIGIPATIDNDITATENTIGFDTAMNTVLEMCDRLRDTCVSHARCNVVEVMGRGAGDIALNTGIALGAVAVVIPEMPFDADATIEKIRHLREDGKRSFLVIVSEGVENFAEGYAKRIEAETGVETKFARLAHVVRGGSPTLADRMLATKMGVHAVDQLLAGKSNLVLCQQDTKIVTYEIVYSQCLDRMYKGTLKEGMLDQFSEEKIAQMKAAIEQKKQDIAALYALQEEIAR